VAVLLELGEGFASQGGVGVELVADGAEKIVANLGGDGLAWTRLRHFEFQISDCKLEPKGEVGNRMIGGLNLALFGRDEFEVEGGEDFFFGGAGDEFSVAINAFVGFPFATVGAGGLGDENVVFFGAGSAEEDRAPI
jgi:hypothetical protein